MINSSISCNLISTPQKIIQRVYFNKSSFVPDSQYLCVSYLGKYQSKSGNRLTFQLRLSRCLIISDAFDSDTVLIQCHANSNNLIHFPQHFPPQVMSNYLKYTLSKDDKFSSSKPQPKNFKSVNMYNLTGTKSDSKWNLDEVLDVKNKIIQQSCSTVEALTDLDKAILRILESKYISEKLLTDDLYEFMLELMNNEYRNLAPMLSLPGAARKKPTESLDKMKKDEELLVLREIDRILAKLLTTNLGQLKNFVNLFKEKLTRTIKILDKNKKKQGLVEFEKLCENNAFQKPKHKQIEEVPAAYSKKIYLEHKENKLKKMKDKSKQSLGTMGSHQNNSDSRHNKSSNKGSIEDGGSLFKLLQDAKKHHAREKYDYSAIMSGSMNIRKRINTEDSNSRQISSVQAKTQKSNKNQGFVFFRPQKGQLPSKSRQ